MNSYVPELGAWLLPAVLAAQDTLITRQVAPEPGWFDTLSTIAQTLISVTLLVLAIALVPAAWNFRKSYKKVNELLDRVYADVNPITRHLSAITDNVDYITTSIREDVRRVNDTVSLANERLRDALAQSEARLQEFNALLQVVQEEAEQAFIATAATVRGVRAGAAALGGGEVEERDADDDVELDENLEDEEVFDGYDDASTPGRRGPAGPRIRRRQRQRRGNG